MATFMAAEFRSTDGRTAYVEEGRGPAPSGFTSTGNLVPSDLIQALGAEVIGNGVWVLQGGTMGEPNGGIPYGAYDDPNHYYNGVDESTPVGQLLGGVGGPVASPVGVPVLVGGTIAGSVLFRVVGGAIGRFIAPLAAAAGGRVSVQALPLWVQQVIVRALVVLGAVATADEAWALISGGVDIVFDTGEDDWGLVPLPDWVTDVAGVLPGVGGGGVGPGDTIRVGNRAYVIASGWVANNVRFWRMVSGHIGVQNKHGVWKVWKPKRPIVLFRTGADDLQTLIQADRAINNQSKRVARVLRNRGFRVARTKEA